MKWKMKNKKEKGKGFVIVLFYRSTSMKTSIKKGKLQ